MRLRICEYLIAFVWLSSGLFTGSLFGQSAIVQNEVVEGYVADWLTYDSRLPKRFGVEIQVAAAIPDTREDLAFEEFEENQGIWRDEHLLFESRSRTYFSPGRQVVKFMSILQQCQVENRLFERKSQHLGRGLPDWIPVRSFDPNPYSPRLEPLLLPAAAGYFFSGQGASIDVLTQMFTVAKLEVVKKSQNGVHATWMTGDNLPSRFRTMVVFDRRVANLPTEFRVTVHEKSLPKADVLEDGGRLVNYARTTWRELDKGIWLPTFVDCVANRGIKTNSDSAHYQISLKWHLNIPFPIEVEQELRAIKNLSK